MSEGSLGVIFIIFMVVIVALCQFRTAASR